ncbi:MAG TPA: hypothetical protein VKQ36_05920, partial [Ktedonobacterales bacterium]|nr:hypothetical protein [Ktedonobacterales bacterium]
RGLRLVRALLALLATGLPMRSGEAEIVAPTGDTWLLRLNAETLTMLGAGANNALISPVTLLTSWEHASAFASEVSTARRAGDLPGMEGWSFRRATEPVILADGVYQAIFTASQGDARIYLVPPPASAEAAQLLARLATRIPLIVLDLALGQNEETATTATGQTDPRLIYFHYGGRKDGSLAALPTLLRQVVAQVTQMAGASRLADIFAEAQTTGALTESQLAARLGCDEDAVAARLGEPSTQAARIAQGLSYVEGFGLCAAEILERAQQAAQDVARKWDTQAQGSPLMIRTLGRRLREITGASEGIECLIAYLGAA